MSLSRAPQNDRFSKVLSQIKRQKKVEPVQPLNPSPIRRAKPQHTLNDKYARYFKN